MSSKEKFNISERPSDDELSDFIDSREHLNVRKDQMDNSRSNNYLSAINLAKTSPDSSAIMQKNKKYQKMYNKLNKSLNQYNSAEFYDMQFREIDNFVNHKRDRSSNPILWPTATLDKRKETYVTGNSNVNFSAVEFLLKHENNNVEVKTLLAKLRMFKPLELVN